MIVKFLDWLSWLGKKYTNIYFILGIMGLFRGLAFLDGLSSGKSTLNWITGILGLVVFTSWIVGAINHMTRSHKSPKIAIFVAWEAIPKHPEHESKIKMLIEKTRNSDNPAELYKFLGNLKRLSRMEKGLRKDKELEKNLPNRIKKTEEEIEILKSKLK